jgi:hypothetical protein
MPIHVPAARQVGSWVSGLPKTAQSFPVMWSAGVLKVDLIQIFRSGVAPLLRYAAIDHGLHTSGPREAWTRFLSCVDIHHSPIIAPTSSCEARYEKGLQPLELGMNVSEATLSHARDMLQRGYYSHT